MLQTMPQDYFRRLINKIEGQTKEIRRQLSAIPPGDPATAATRQVLQEQIRDKEKAVRLLRG